MSFISKYVIKHEYSVSLCVWDCIKCNMQNLFERFITPCIDYIIEGLNNMRKQNPLKTVIHQTNLNMLTQFCYVFDAMFPLSQSAKSSASSTSVLSITSSTPTSVPIANPTVLSSECNEYQYSDDIIECGFIEVTIIFHFTLILVCI